MEALIILRDCIMANKSVHEDGRFLVVGGRRVAMDTPTAFMVGKKKGTYYAIGSLFLQFKNRTLPFASLRQLCQQKKVAYVRPTDKPHVIQYLTGKSDDGAGRIDTEYQGVAPAAAAVGAPAPSTKPAAAKVASAVATAKSAFQTDLEAAQALDGPMGTMANVGEDTMKHPGPLDASLPRAAKRRRLITKESIVSFQEFLNHDVPFTQDILKRESAAINLHSLMNARTKDMLKMFDSLKKQRAAVHKARSKAAKQSRRIVAGTPIIIVPAAPSSIINMYNVKRFLEDGVYEETSVAKVRAGGVKPAKVTVVAKQPDGSKIRFNVIDSINLLSDPRQWEKVVAVFVHGPTWQFKKWIWKTPVDIFSHVLGFHLRYSNDEAHPNAQKWRVRHLLVSKTTRNRDPVAQQEFWRHTLEYTRVSKPHLLKATA